MIDVSNARTKKTRRPLAIILISLSFLLNSYYCMAIADFEVNGIYYRIVSIENLTCVVSHPLTYGSGVPIDPLKFEFRPRLDNNLIVGSERGGNNHYKGHVVIPEAVTYKGKTLSVIGIDSEAFRLCRNLLSVRIPSSVTDIGDYAFYCCSSLTKIDGSLNASIGRYAFAGCTALSTIIVNGGTFISAGAFMFCTSLTNIKVSNTVLKIGEGAFSDCPKIKELRLDDGSKDLYIHSFICGNSVMQSYSNEKLYVGRNIFYDPHTSGGWIDNCPFGNFEELVIGDSVETLVRGVAWVGELDKRQVDKTFGNPFDVKSLKTLVIGKSMTIIPSFEEARLEHITLNCNRPPVVDGSFSMYSIMNARVVVPSGCLSTYMAATPWKDFVINEK